MQRKREGEPRRRRLGLGAGAEAGAGPLPTAGGVTPSRKQAQQGPRGRGTSYGRARAQPPATNALALLARYTSAHVNVYTLYARFVHTLCQASDHGSSIASSMANSSMAPPSPSCSSPDSDDDEEEDDDDGSSSD
eukprot:COSAG06_NODE_168_length_21479_cov_65.517774_3_plen_135_part_00